MSIGEKIIAAIEDGKLQSMEEVWGGVKISFKPNAAEQLEAVVEAHIEERVLVRMELDLQQRTRPNEMHHPAHLAEVLKLSHNYGILLGALQATAVQLPANSTLRLRIEGVLAVVTEGKKPDEYPAD